MNATTIAIREAAKSGSIRVVEREGRFGAFFAICDERGTIEVCDTAAEAAERISECLQQAVEG